MARSLEGAVWHEGSETWMIPQNDPYTLDNFRQALDNLRSGKSTQTQALTRTQADELSGIEELEATHYALRIYPRTEDEEWAIESMEDVKVSYTPLDHTPLAKEEIERLPRNLTRVSTDGAGGTGGAGEIVAAESAVYPEECRYTVRYDAVSLDGYVDTTTYRLPVLYAVWPASKPLPEELDYEVDYEVFLPHEAASLTRNGESLSSDALWMLENEAVALALGTTLTKPAGRTRAAVTLSGTLDMYDQSAENPIYPSYPLVVPLANMKVKYKLGSAIYETNTLSNGSFTINVPSMPVGMEQTLTLSSIDSTYGSMWKIAGGKSSTNPYTIDILLGSSQAGGTSLSVRSMIDEYQFFTIHRAANYYYNAQPWFSYVAPSGGMRIVAKSGPRSGTPGVAGAFFHTANPPYIEIYRMDSSYVTEKTRDGSVIGATLHELGHLCHFMSWPYPSGRRNHLENTPTLLVESFASYVGWFLGEEYYKSVGRVKTGNSLRDITDQDRQEWPSNPLYSPIFIDLTDDYNQASTSSVLPNDVLSGLSPYEIMNIVMPCTTWSEYKERIGLIALMHNPIYEINAYLYIYENGF